MTTDANTPTTSNDSRNDAVILADTAKIYIGYYGRSPEPKGFDYWIAEAQRGFTALETAASFSVQDESKAKYPYLADPETEDPDAFIVQVYQNLFNRDPDSLGKAYWKEQLDAANGEPQAVGRMILDIINGARNTPDGQDLTTINNKMAVALDWVESVREISDFEYAGNDEAAVSAVSVIEDVDETSQSVSEGLAETDAYVASNQPGERFSLTENVDGVQDYTGTASDDTYTATAETLNTGDHLDGAGGRDKLTIQAGQADSIVATPILESIEEVEIRGGADALKAEFDFSASTGVEKGILNGVTGSVEFVGVQYPFDLMVRDGDTTLEALIDRMNETEATLTVDYASQSVTGDADVQKLDVANAGLNRLDVEGIERLEITGTGTNFINNIGSVSDVKVDGDGRTIVTFGFDKDTTTRSMDATDATGDTTAFFNGSENVFAAGGSGDDYFGMSSGSTIEATGGAGDDIFRVSGRGVDESDTIDGGDGKDMLLLSRPTSANAEVINDMSGLEVLGFRGSTQSIDVSQFDEIHEFFFEGSISRNARDVSISGIESEDHIVFQDDQTKGDSTLSFSGEAVGETLSLELRALEDGVFSRTYAKPDEGEGNIEIIADGSTESDSDEDDFISAIALDDNFSSVEIASTGVNERANEISAVQDESTDYDYFAFANADGPSAFTIVGDHDLTIGAAKGDALTAETKQWGFADAAKVDASAFTGDLRIAMSSDEDVLVAGSGDDILYGMQGDDRLTGNEGADQFRFVGGDGTDTILDFLVEDDMIGFNLFDFANTDASYEGTALDSDDYVENRDSISDLGNGDDGKMVELQKALSAGQIAQDTGDEIEAYVLVFNSTTEQAELWYDENWSDADGREMVTGFDSVVDLVGVQDFTNQNFVEFIA